MRKFVFSIFILSSCIYSENNKTSYIDYYDKSKGNKKLEGEFLNGNENGLWKYYSPEGFINQEGSFSNGLLEGVWIYHNLDSVNSIDWNIIEVDSIKFSLPKSFIDKTELSSSASKLFIDSNDNTVVSISIISEIDSMYMNDYFSQNVNSFNQHFFINKSSSSIIKSPYNLFYLDEFELINKTQTLKQFMIYKLINGSTMLVVSVTNENKRSVYLKFIIGEIFNHTLIHGVRINNPYEIIL